MKTLISATVALADRTGLAALEERFSSEGFEVFQAPLEPDAIDLGTPELLLQNLPEERRSGRKALLTNSLIYAVSWFRCWNHAFDDFIFFVDPASPAMAAPANDALTNALATGCGEDTPLRGYVYCTLTLQTAPLFFDLMFLRRTFRLIEVMDAFEFGETPSRASLVGKKRYVFGETSVSITADDPEKEEIETNVDLSVSDDELTPLVLLAARSPAMVPYAAIAILDTDKLDLNQKSDLVRLLLGPYLSVHPEEREPLAERLAPLIDEPDRSPQRRGILGFHLGYLTHSTRILESFARASKFHLANTPFDFPGFIVTYALEQWFQIDAYPGFLRDQAEVLQRCLREHRPALRKLCRAKARRRPRSLLFLAGEADGINYGPVNSSFGMAKLAKRDFPDWRVGVLFTDRHRLDPADFVSPADRPVSSRHRDELAKKLDHDGIELMFAPDDSRLARTAATIDMVRQWAPSIICSVADDRDIARGLLFEDYPVIEVHIGGLIEKPDDADLSLCAFDAELRSDFFDYFETPNEIRGRFETYFGTVEFGEPARTHARSDYGIPEDAFVLAIVGYNIEEVLRVERIDFLAEIMQRQPEVHLALVGKDRLPTVQAQLDDRLWERTHVLGKQDDLPGFLLLCDAVFCPSQRGAGFTHCTAMALGVPTVVEYTPFGDVTVNVGRSQTFEGTESLRDALLKVISDAAFRSELVERNRQAIVDRKVKSEQCIQRLFEFFPLAERRFRERTGKPASASKRPPSASRRPRRKAKSKRSPAYRR